MREEFWAHGTHALVFFLFFTAMQCQILIREAAVARDHVCNQVHHKESVSRRFKKTIEAPYPELWRRLRKDQTPSRRLIYLVKHS